MSFRREKYVPKGGPDGGDGGRGGSVFITADENMHSLLDYRGGRHINAPRGGHGKGRNKHGKKGNDIIIKVPKGTMVFDKNTGELVADIRSSDQKYLVAKGGRGGRGNARFSSSTKQAPREWEVGGPPIEKELQFELKLIADVGLVGLPNAGKSTLLSRLSQAKPKIANYPFTTLRPNLGVVHYKDYATFMVADIPGLIEGAHVGKGLGHEFLRHIERTRVLLFLLDIQNEDPFEDYKTLLNELRSYDPGQLEKPHVIVLNKCDTVQDDIRNKIGQVGFENFPLLISAVTGEGINALIENLWSLISDVDLAPEK